MVEDLLDHRWIFNAGDHAQRTATGTAGLDIDIESTPEALGPRHRGTAPGRSVAGSVT
jgi:hypothetical protein